jgi:hypothetical protein
MVGYYDTILKDSFILSTINDLWSAFRYDKIIITRIQHVMEGYVSHLVQVHSQEDNYGHVQLKTNTFRS